MGAKNTCTITDSEACQQVVDSTIPNAFDFKHTVAIELEIFGLHNGQVMSLTRGYHSPLMCLMECFHSEMVNPSTHPLKNIHVTEQTSTYQRKSKLVNGTHTQLRVAVSCTLPRK